MQVTTGRVQDKVALVTGAARGMGQAISRRLAQEGAKVVALDVASLDAVVAEVENLGGEVLPAEVDVRDAAALQEAVDLAAGIFGPVDIAAINHGVAGGGRSWEIDSADWQRMLDVNLTGVWHVAKAVIPRMIERRAGSIVITASTASVQASANLSHYVASKHGVLGLMRSLAVELGPDLVRVNAVLPGAVDTPLLQSARAARVEKARKEGTEAALIDDTGPGVMPVGLLDPADIANAVLWLGSDEARSVTGVALPVDAGSLVAPAHRT